MPGHLAEVREPKLAPLKKTEAAVMERLTKEITYWDHRAAQLKLQEQAGKPNARLNPPRPVSGLTCCRRACRNGLTN
ncbi:MAG: hypothetical protein R2712_25290 [Vicinamibacterales bacterium]